MTRVVLHVSQPTDGGTAVCVRRLAADQIARGWRVVAAVPPGTSLAADLDATGAAVLEWPATRAPGLSSLAESGRLARIIARVDPDLVHLHSSKAGLAGRMALRGRVPTVFQPHAWSFEAATGTVRRAVIAWERFACRWADAVVCVSEAERRAAESLGLSAPFAVIPNGVDLSSEPGGAEGRSAARRRLGLGEGPLVVCAGRLDHQKGQDILLDGWADVARRVPGARLVLVGDGEQRARLESAAAGQEVVFVGQKDNVAEWLTAADVVAMPSRWEGMSLLMLETLAAGRSLVITDVCGAREVVAAHEAGAVVPVEDPAALAAALVQRLADPDLAAAEGRRGREAVEHHHDLADANLRMASLYEDVLLERAGGDRGR